MLRGDYLDVDDFKRFITTRNDLKSCRCSGYDVALDVSFLHSCLLLNLHGVGSVDDPVQQRVRVNIRACDKGASFTDYVRSMARAVLVVHATRQYE